MVSCADSFCKFGTKSPEVRGTVGGLSRCPLRLKYPNHIKALQKRGLARADDGLVMSWMNVLQTDKMAVWSCEAAGNIMLALAEMFRSREGRNPSATVGCMAELIRKLLTTGRNAGGGWGNETAPGAAQS